MDSRKITGLSMIIAPVIAILGWIGMGLIVLDGASPDDPAKWMSELGANSEVVKFVMPLITVLFLIAIGGLNRIKNSMEGGEGHMMAGFGFLLVILGSAAQLGEVAFTVATAEAVNTNMSVAPAMLASGQAIGAISTAITAVGFGLIGVGILQQKNFTPLVAGLMIIAGIFGTAMSLIDYESPLMMIGYLGMVASLVWLGASLLRQED
ncbi:MAG TPA: hypothetical protein QF838_06175 [SAR202 cluster bacterium]|nr:hypothetical protein [SAR202 cluster bacterium]HJO60301.1 hypothetical protein [SAR202 cluster bacterium]